MTAPRSPCRASTPCWSPGPYPLRIEATLPDGSKQAFEQNVLVASGFYPQDPMLIVPPETLDPAVTEPEMQQVESIVAPATPTKQWQGLFASPAAYPDCFHPAMGTVAPTMAARTNSFHSGLDFCGGAGLPIYAPADGTVVFAGPLTVRGNATIIDHGWGIYSGYWHQSEMLVKAGDQVEKGQQIGVVGGTGRVTGAHLHWEVWANGVQVDPMDWLNYVLSLNQRAGAMSSIAEFLKDSDIFDQLTATQLEMVANICSEERYSAGQVIFEENSASKELYVIARGEVEILISPTTGAAAREGAPDCGPAPRPILR